MYQVPEHLLGEVDESGAVVGQFDIAKLEEIDSAIITGGVRLLGDKVDMKHIVDKLISCCLFFAASCVAFIVNAEISTDLGNLGLP